MFDADDVRRRRRMETVFADRPHQQMRYLEPVARRAGGLAFIWNRGKLATGSEVRR
jgi:hypothetical protein